MERIEQEYVRHGTSGLLASRRVQNGQIVAPLIQLTRTEEDFERHIRAVIRQAPQTGYRFIVDNLNTHQFEAPRAHGGRVGTTAD